jgi:hypothetical protein
MIKRIGLVLVLALIALVPVAAQAINLGNFPLGSFVDPNYDAVWEFTSGNIRILDMNGTVIFDFGQNTIRDFRVGLEGVNPVVSFSCVESRRGYRFVRPLNRNVVNMTINAPWNPNYQVELRAR